MTRAMALGVLVSVVIPLAVSAAQGRGPGAGWKFAFHDFAIGAWNPPADTAAEYRAYREAGFNLVMSPRYALPDKALQLAAKYGLRVLVDTYTPNDRPWGGNASAYTPHPTHHPATLPELQWLHARYGNHPSLAGYLLGDDYGAVPPELVATTQFLHDHAPQLIPWICQNVMSAESLAKAGNPIQDPQIYPTLYQHDWPAADQGLELCQQLQKLRRGCLSHDLIPWPMFNVCGVESDSLLRFQVYASLAFGAQGIWYFTYRDGLQKGAGYEDEATVRANLLPGWAVAAEANKRVAGWGPRLLGLKTAGLFATGTPISGCATPGKGKLIEAMSDELLVGVGVKDSAAPQVMVVDRRVDKLPGAVPRRAVTVRFARAVNGIEVLGPAGSRRVAGHAIRLTLAGGAGQLLVLTGQGLEPLCSQIEPTTVAQTGDRKVGADGLLMALSFEAGQGETAHDSSGAGNDVSLHAVTWVPGRTGGGISFAGKGSYGRIEDAYLPATDAMSVAVWVRPKYADGAYGPVLVIGSGGCDRFEFGFGPDDLYPVISNQESHSGAALYVSGMKALIPPDTWGHLAVCAGPDGATTYVNGKSVAHSSYAGTFDFTVKEVLVGVRGAEYYHGDLDDLRLWNRCLSAEEVAALAQP
jgi:hypothetical protein